MIFREIANASKRKKIDDRTGIINLSWKTLSLDMTWTFGDSNCAKDQSKRLDRLREIKFVSFIYFWAFKTGFTKVLALVFVRVVAVKHAESEEQLVTIFPLVADN